jgi:hypothetical protein
MFRQRKRDDREPAAFPAFCGPASRIAPPEAFPARLSCASGLCSSVFGAVASVIAANASREDASTASAADAIRATIVGLRVSSAIFSERFRAARMRMTVLSRSAGMINRRRKISVGGKEQRGLKKAREDEVSDDRHGTAALVEGLVFLRRVLRRAAGRWARRDRLSRPPGRRFGWPDPPALAGVTVDVLPSPQDGARHRRIRSARYRCWQRLFHAYRAPSQRALGGDRPRADCRTVRLPFYRNRHCTSADYRDLARVVERIFSRRWLDCSFHCALSRHRRFLATCGVDANTHAGSCRTCRRNKLTVARSVYASIPMVVCFRLSRVRCGTDYLLADDRASRRSILGLG